MFKRLGLSLALLLSAAFFAAAQTVKGRITIPDGTPVEGNYIHNPATNTHTHSNEMGLFTIDKTNVGDVLTVGGLGYKIQQIEVASNDPLNITIQPDVVQLDDVVITPRFSSLNSIIAVDLKVIPVNSSQEILRKVPGLFIGQHAGGGKAEQLFMRGFDMDHGTDVAVSVDGMPVNMPSHAHGQGYADLHFMIPETMGSIDFGKGPGYADKGDFSTGGYVAMQTLERIEKSTVGLEIGQFNTHRLLGMFDLLGNTDKRHSAYLASEYLLTDGPFDAPQNLSRINLFGKYTATIDNGSKFSVTASHFTSKWDASGQIPLRLVEQGVISWFGSVDDTEGGQTSRTNVNTSLFKTIGDRTSFKANAYYAKYDFELYSNFTFFLNDSVNGDQIRQKESRQLLGLNTDLKSEFNIGNALATFQAGVGFRTDQIDNLELSRTRDRLITLEPLALGDARIADVFGYASLRLKVGKFVAEPAVRAEHIQFNYYDKLDSVYNNNRVQRTVLLPKLNLILSPSDRLQLYLKSGVSFHSNDVRVVIFDPGKPTLPLAYGSDLGIICKPLPRLIFNAAAWYLYLEQEFVYVGDEAVIEPSGSTRRLGADVGLRFQVNDILFLDADANYAHARYVDEPEGENYVPLAPVLTATAGIGISNWHGLSGSYRFRFMADRPANEDNSIIAKGFSVSDVTLNYQYRRIMLGITVENIFNVKWKETQFATESRLRNEAASVEEIHFIPGTPRFLRARLSYNF